MAASVNIHEAKTHFSKLVSRVMAGEEVLIAKAGQPVARLVPVSPRKAQRRVPGIDRGKIRIAEGAFEPLSETELAEWYAPLPARRRK